MGNLYLGFYPHGVCLSVFILLPAVCLVFITTYTMEQAAPSGRSLPTGVRISAKVSGLGAALTASISESPETKCLC